MLLFVQVAGECVQAHSPEFLIAGEPGHRVAHWIGLQGAGDHSTLFRTRQEPRIFERVQVLHEPWQRHRERTCQLAHRLRARSQRRENRAAGRIRQGTEYAVQMISLILNHYV